MNKVIRSKEGVFELIQEPDQKLLAQARGAHASDVEALSPGSIELKSLSGILLRLLTRLAALEEQKR